MSSGSFDSRINGLLKQMLKLLSPAAAACSSSRISARARRFVSFSAAVLGDLKREA